jgi:hypothetical protein
MDTLEPIEDVIARIERRLEHEYQQCAVGCVYCARLDCVDCEKVDIMAMDSAAPIATHVDPCSAHA